MVSDMKTNKKLSPIITELFMRGGKLNISLVFISESENFKLVALKAKFWYSEDVNKNPI